MKHTSKLNYLAVCLIALFSIPVVGCGGSGDFVPVSGTVTLKGETVEGLMVVFEPLPTATSSNVGPFSEAITDAAGKYTLETRYGDPGAVLGKHRVFIQYADFDPAAADNAAAELREAQQAGNAAPAEALADLKAAKSKPKVPRQYNEENSTMEFLVPAGGTDKANFDLK